MQLLFWVGGGGWADCGWWWLGGLRLNKTKLMHISTQVEVVFEVWLEIVLKINFHGWVGFGCGAYVLGGWLDQLRLRLSQLPT